MLHELFTLELLKLRRSRVLLLTVAIPLLLVLVNALMLARRVPLAAIDGAQWLRFWESVSAQWCYPVMPLHIALVTALMNGQEHRCHGWRMLLTLPVSQLQLFTVKAFVAWLAALAAMMIVIASAASSVLVLAAAGARLQGAFAFDIGTLMGTLALTMLPVVAIQHALSWRVRNLAAPLALGVAATLAINPVGQSRYWMACPWTYTPAALGPHPEALLLAAVSGLALFAASACLLARREVEY